MKKLDKLILGSFLGPFLLTFIVVDFILLTVNMLKYFDEIFGKDLGFGVYMELIGYFVISISPMALPLAVLLSSLMTFGNLGEHFELTAIKSSGISLLRALLPIGVFVVFLTFFAYLSNNYVVPRVNLKTFSLLYDIRMKSPALDIKEGIFYNGMPNYSIKVNRKLDDVRLKDIIIYDHTEGQGNINVILADSGRMEPFFNDRYMKLTLYSGYSYSEEKQQRGIRSKPVNFWRTKFDENEMVFNLDAFQMNRTPENLWSSNRSIKNIGEIKVDIDSMDVEHTNYLYSNYSNVNSAYSFFGRDKKITAPEDIQRKKALADSIKNMQWKRKMEMQERGKANVLAGDTTMPRNPMIEPDTVMAKAMEKAANANDSIDSMMAKAGADTLLAEVDSLKQIADTKESGVKDSLAIDSTSPVQDTNLADPSGKKVKKVEEKKPAPVAPAYLNFSKTQIAKLDSIISNGDYEQRAASMALNSARTLKNNFSQNQMKIDGLEREQRRFHISWYQKYTQAFACIVMFMIGAPLGAIIKKGGLGMPVLFSIIFFIIFYMLTITGEKWAKEGVTSALFGTWFSNLTLLPIGLFFLKQARKDARLFDADIYQAAYEKLKSKLSRKNREN